MVATIEVLPSANWGGAKASNIEAVCNSVVACFGAANAERPVELIRVEPTATEEHPPRAVYERAADGRVRIFLGVRGNLWAKLAYQFAHEYCHVLANFRPPLVHRAMWIEESVCEMSSLYALRAMGSGWLRSPPYKNWASYGEHLTDYANKLVSDQRRNLPADVDLRDWLPNELPAMEIDPGRRDANAVVAHQLLPHFEADAGAWRAIRYLNLWPPQHDLRINEYLIAWRRVLPENLQHVSDTILLQLTGSNIG